MSGFAKPEASRELAALAAQGTYIGTSSWKYEGWLGQLYTNDRYSTRNKFSQAKFERECLSEYAEVFKTVCVDAAYYTFPTTKYLTGLASQTPDDFRFGFKVTDAITIKQFPNLPRFGQRAGKPNEQFLNADLFASGFLRPCESIRPKIGLLMFEFSKFWTRDYAHGRDFMADLDTFLGRLPSGWPYGVEIRNQNFLRPEYFAMLRKHRVAHVFNSWEGMPSIAEQLALPDSFTAPDLVGARLLLKPGRKYEEAVKAFSPYDRIRDPFPEGTAAAAELIRKAKQQLSRGTVFVYVNNRFEGNALETVATILKQGGVGRTV